MYMGQRHGKQAKLTPQQSTSSKRRSATAQPQTQQQHQQQVSSATLLAPGASNELQTGNLVITIRMLTMNSNEANDTSTTTGTGSSSSSNNNNNNNNDDGTSNDMIAVDQSKNNNNQITVTVQHSTENDVGACDTQKIIPSPSLTSSTSTLAASSCSNCLNGSSSLADKISNMLSSRCNSNSNSNSSSSSSSNSKSAVPLTTMNLGSSMTTQQTVAPTTTKATKLKKSNWSLGKLTGRSKRDKKKELPNASSVVVELNVEKTDSYYVGDEKSRVTAEPTVINSNELTPAATVTAAAAAAAAATTPSSSAVPRFPRSTSISLINGISATAPGAGSAAILLPDPARAVASGQPFIHSKATLYGSLSNGTSGGNFILVSPFIDVTRTINSDDYSLEDLDEQARWRRALQIAEGIEAPPGFIPRASSPPSISSLHGNPVWQTVVTDAATMHSLMNQFSRFSLNPEELPRVHSQADYIHCLVPDLEKIIKCCFYWGKMDRFEAEKLLDGKPEGTFLLRDSAQEDYLFSVSFRKYGRSLHARVEQFNHEFSFDSHDPGVYTAPTVTGLLEHYKDPSCVMFFEPMLTLPLHRNFVFPLQELARATIVSNTTYDGIDKLDVPRVMKTYLKDYHYKQRVHYKRFDEYDCDS